MKERDNTMKKLFQFGFSVLLTVLMSAVSYAAHSNFTANLSGQQEVPAVISSAQGSAAITLTGAGGLRYSLTVNGLSGPVTAAHFHLGSLKTNGPVLYDITSSFTGNTALGSIAAPLPDSVVEAFLTGRIYVNVHTAANPSGEIRGQVNLSSGTNLIARFDGRQENPPLVNSATGTASITMESVGSVGLVYNISVSGLSGAITGAHFHFGNIGQNGPVVKDITSSFIGENAVGVWRTSGVSPLNDSLIVALLTGKLYLNIHTSANPGGETRGQIMLAAGFGANANLNGASENPSVITTAKGTAEMTFADYGLVFSITADGLSGPITGAHIHDADSGSNGPVVFDITSLFINNSATGRWKASGTAGDLTPALLKRLFANGLYVNIHTAANPSGEIRGQIKLKAGSGIGGTFTGNQEVPNVTTTASGSAALFTVSTGLQYFVTVTGLSGPITGAHFHLGSVKENGPVVKDITASFTGNTASGIWAIADATPFNDSLRRNLVNGRIYMNIHTAANPGGEIRAQVVLTAGSGMTASINGAQENPSVISSARGTGQFTLTRGGLGFNISTNGLSGPVTGAHFHLGAPGQNGPVVFDILSSLSGNNLIGYWRPVVAIDSLFNALLNGRIYVNIHTAANPGGEIRGQVLMSEGVGIVTQITGGQENPPTTTNARGSGSATMTDAGLIFYNTFSGLTGDAVTDNAPTAVHFHNAPAGTNGPVVRDLMSNLSGNNVTGSWKRTETMNPITNALLAEVYNQNIYINLHSAEYPGGEIRGQLRTGALNLIPYQIISSITLSPLNDTKPINSQHCVSATITDQSGNPVRNANVQFSYSGANSGSGSGMTDTAGVASFCYTGTALGTDTIVAEVVGLMATAFVFWDEALPVELISFSATVERKNVKLNWTTSEEINNAGFDIERSFITGGVNGDWIKAGNVKGNGTVNNSVNYSYTDKNLSSGKYDYRLKQIDLNGNFEYFNLSNEVEISTPVEFKISQNYPNPFNPSTKIDFDIPEDANVNVVVFDNSGRLVKSLLNEFKPAGYYTLDFNASDLSSGVYFYRIQTKNYSKVLKMTLIK